MAQLFSFLLFVAISVNAFGDTDIDNDINNGVVVRTKFGYLRGVSTNTSSGFGVDVFRGIPFANTPERLKKSTLVNRWFNVRNAQNRSAKCIPNSKPIDLENFSEDCLYLNVLTPSSRVDQANFPVVVFIHGGGFQEGDGEDASLDGFAEKFVTQEIIVVTIQYRLAALGFLSLGCDSPVFPCNVGLWDQLVAFDFVNQTIDSFGGDRNNMTLMGHSAGAMSASLHTISPISSKYFKKYIQLSGSAWGLPKFSKDNKDFTKKILHGLECDISNRTQDFYDCINKKSLDELYFAQIGTHLWPEIGDEIFPEVPTSAVEVSKDQKLFTGLQTLEALYFTYLQSDPSIFPHIERPTIADYINSTIAVNYGIDSQDAYEIASQYFLPLSVPDNDYPFYMKQRSKIDSNTLFDIPVLREIREKIPYSGSIYAYHFEYFNKQEFDEHFPVKATYHCQEFPYIWGDYKDRHFDLDDDDIKVSNFLCSSLVNFIKIGDPSSSEFNWPATNNNLKHVRIQPSPVVENDLFQDDYDFWENMRSTFQYDLITGLPYLTKGSSSFSVVHLSMLVALIHRII